MCNNQLLKAVRINHALKSARLPFSTLSPLNGTEKVDNTSSEPQSKSKLPSNDNFANIKAELVKTFKTLLDLRKNPTTRTSARHNDMFQRQLALEEEQFDLAVQDYVDIQSGLMAMGRGTSMKSVQKTMVSWYEPLCTLIEKEVLSYTSDQKKIESEVGVLFLSYCYLTYLLALWSLFSRTSSRKTGCNNVEYNCQPNNVCWQFWSSIGKPCARNW